MAKDTFYFSHDYNARNDDKIKQLIRKHGMLGYGIWWAIVEDLYNNANALRTDYEGIAFDLREDIKIVESVINDFGLFQVENGFFGSTSIEKRLDDRNSKSVKARESAHKRWNKSERNANAMRTHSEGNAIKESKGNEINEIEEIKKSNGFFLIQEFSKIFYSENPNYEPSQEKDFPALRLFAEHVSKKLFQTSNFAEKSKPEQLLILEELKKVSKWYKETKCIKSLETLAKFQMQEVFIKIKQGFQTFKKAEEYVPNFPTD